jgi:hypothetical protein
MIALDRGYDALVPWLLSAGFDLVHTQQRSKSLLFTFDAKRGVAPGQLVIPTDGEMAAYWAKKKFKVPNNGTREVTMWLLAFRIGTGSVVLLTTTNPQWGPAHWTLMPMSTKFLTNDRNLGAINDRTKSSSTVDLDVLASHAAAAPRLTTGAMDVDMDWRSSELFLNE